ncbi:SynChlorMet cassette radical SAM/SPASM protein ScmE [Thermodesulfobacteriota bacterium]
MSTPREVDIEITSKCNLRCKYCYFFDNPDPVYIDLPADEWIRFFRELSECRVMYITLVGGEPFIRKDLPEIINGITENRMRFSILSNGSLINDETARFIKKTGRCDIVQVSLDGSRPETHDILRGEGSFAGAIRGLEILKKNNVPVTIRVTVHRHNIEDLENIAYMLLEKLEIPSFSTNSAGVLGSCRLNTDDIVLTINEREEAMKKLLYLSAKYPGRITAEAGPLAEALHWNQMIEASKGNNSTIEQEGYLTGCGCSQSKIAVRSDGTIIPCSMLTNMEMGKINKDSIKDLWQNSPTLIKLRNRKRIALDTFESCKDCEYIKYCTGNCPGIAYSTTGEVDYPSPDACLKKFIDEGGKVPDIKKY